MSSKSPTSCVKQYRPKRNFGLFLSQFQVHGMGPFMLGASLLHSIADLLSRLCWKPPSHSEGTLCVSHNPIRLTSTVYRVGDPFILPSLRNESSQVSVSLGTVG